MRNNFKEALNKIDISAERKDAILDNILSVADEIRYKKEKKEKKIMNNKFKYALAGVGIMALIALAVMTIPSFIAQPQTSQNAVDIAESPEASEAQPALAVFELSVKSTDSSQYIKLASLTNGDKIGTKNTLPSDFFTFDEKEKLDSYSGIDFMVENPNAVKVIFESKNYDLDYEDSRNWVTDDKTPTWSECYFTIDLVDLDGKQDFSRDEVVAALENFQISSNQKYKVQLMQFADRLYTSEEQAVINSGGDPIEFLEGKLDEPIDFNRYLAEYNVENDEVKGFDYEYLVIKFINPDNRPIQRVVGRKIETRPGESVLWMLNGNDLFGKQKSEIDFSAITDEITVTVVYANGSQQKQVWKIEFSENGKPELYCEDVKGNAV